MTGELELVNGFRDDMKFGSDPQEELSSSIDVAFKGSSKQGFDCRVRFLLNKAVVED